MQAALAEDYCMREQVRAFTEGHSAKRVCTGRVGTMDAVLPACVCLSMQSYQPISNGRPLNWKGPWLGRNTIANEIRPPCPCVVDFVVYARVLRRTAQCKSVYACITQNRLHMPVQVIWRNGQESSLVPASEISGDVLSVQIWWKGVYAHQ